MLDQAVHVRPTFYPTLTQNLDPFLGVRSVGTEGYFSVDRVFVAHYPKMSVRAGPWIKNQRLDRHSEQDSTLNWIELPREGMRWLQRPFKKTKASEVWK